MCLVNIYDHDTVSSRSHSGRLAEEGRWLKRQKKRRASTMPYRVLEVSYTADGPEACWRTGDIADEQTARDHAQTLLLRTKVNDDTDFVVMELPIAWLSDLAKKS